MIHPRLAHATRTLFDAVEKVAAGNSKAWLDHSASSTLPSCLLNDRKEASAV